MNDVLEWDYDMEKCPQNQKVFLLSDDEFPILPQNIYVGTIIDNGRFKTRGECFMGDRDYFYRSKIIAWLPFSRKTLNWYFISNLSKLTKNTNTESAHIKADDLLCDLLDLLGYNEVVSTYYSVPKWYS